MFEDWLRERHGRMATPRTELEDIVERATGSKAVTLERLIVGQVNEVYDVATRDGQDVIVRISHGDDPRLQAEAWAFDQARAAGVPTPRVLLVDDTLSVLEKLPGIGLDVALRRGDLPAGVYAHLGELLARLHSVRVDGFGYLQPDGRGWPITFASIMLDLLEQRDKVAAAAMHWNVPARQVDRGLTLLADHVELYDWDDARLIHGDFGGNNILVDGDRVTGVLDLEECSGGHPAFDLASWPRLRETYAGDPCDERLIQLVRIRDALWMLMVRVDQQNPHEVSSHVEDLDEALAWFGQG